MYNFRDFTTDIDRQLQLYTNVINSLNQEILVIVHSIMIETLNIEDLKTNLYQRYFHSANMQQHADIELVLNTLAEANMVESNEITEIKAKNNIAESIVCLYLINYYKLYPDYKVILRQLYARFYELFSKENPHNTSLKSILEGANNSLYDEYLADIGSEEFDLLYFNKKIIKLWKKYREQYTELESYLDNEIFINGILISGYNREEFAEEKIKLKMADAFYIDMTGERYVALSVYDKIDSEVYLHPYSNEYTAFTTWIRDEYGYDSSRLFSTFGSAVTSRPISITLNEYLKSSKYGEFLAVDMSTTSRELLLFHNPENNSWSIMSYGYLKPLM